MMTDLTRKKATLPQLTKPLGKLFLLIDRGIEVLLGKAYQLTKTHIWSLIFYRRNRKHKN